MFPIPPSPWLEQAHLLLRKARQDAVIVARAVVDTDIADEIAGFHAQQAGEKCFKAVLALQRIPYRRTHDLQELHDLLSDHHVMMPADVVELVEWSPFAVAYRYDDWSEPDPVDRARADALVRAVIAWTEQQFSGPSV